MTNPFFELAAKRGTLLAAHRGCCGGNIPCNSIQSFQIALNQGTDIMELDVERSSDNKLFIQHPGMEKVHLRFKDSITDYDSSVVSQMKLSNNDMNKTQYPIARLEEVLDLLRGKCLINIDKFWYNPAAISKLIHERGMEDQIVVKSKMDKMSLADIEELAKGLYFMPVVDEEDKCLDTFDESKIRFIGTEVLFKTEDCMVTTQEYIERMHEAGKVIWVNPIVYNYKKVLTAGHTDDIAVVSDPEFGWGWLADRYDILQTDWLLQCDLFLKESGRRK